MVAISYLLLAAGIKVCLWVLQLAWIWGSKSRFWPFFDNFGHFQTVRFGMSLWHRTVILLPKFSPIYVLSRVIKNFKMTVTIEPKINKTQTRFSKNLAKSVFWSGPYKMQISVLLIRKTWNLVSAVSRHWWHGITQ